MKTHVKLFEAFLNEGVPEKDMHVYQVVCRDPDGTLKEIIECIAACGNTGHTFSVIVDPDAEKPGERKFEWDGDGADYIKEVKVISEPVKESEEAEKTANGPAFSIRDKQPGDTVVVQGETVKIVKFNSWTKDKEASCMSFKAEKDGEEINVTYSDAHDGYIFNEGREY